MRCNKTVIAFLLILFVSLFMVNGFGGLSARTQESTKGVYLKNNIHVQEHGKSGEYRGSYANWTDPGTGHVVIPVNTLVSKGHFKRGFAIIIQSTQKPVLFEFDAKAAGMSDEEYFSLITSPDPVELEALPQIDRKGVQEGKAYEGMTKEGVRIALGYPAPHKTPSLEKSTWYYWTNRFRSIAIEFDGTGKVITVGGKQGSSR